MSGFQVSSRIVGKNEYVLMSKSGKGQNFFDREHISANDRFKCLWVPYPSVYPVKCPGYERKSHENIVGDNERRFNTAGIRRGESEAGIIPRVTDNDDDAVAKELAGIKPLLSKGDTDPPALEIRVNNKGSEREGGNDRIIGFYGDIREHDMADYPVIEHRDKGKVGIKIPILPQRVH